ncbi:MAG: ABC transporter permease [Treponema sp.]|nr:ABC transporter permease [Treponema sp.]
MGIIIGVGSVIVMVAMGEGSQKVIEEKISSMGANVLQIQYRRPPARSVQAVYPRRTGFTKEDVEHLRQESSFARAVSGVSHNNQDVFGREGSVRIRVHGVDPDFSIARNYHVDEGVFFENGDMVTRNRVAVLGRTTAANLFSEAESALSQQIRIGSNYFTVIGLLERKGAGLDGNDQDDIVLVPLDTAMTRIQNTRELNQIIISVTSKEFMDAAIQETDLILRESRGIPDRIASDFSIMNQVDMIDMAAGTSRTLTMLLAAIAGVSLFVGGIGIMNIMLVSVTERTREIGIRMAVGGRKRDILFQFLSEAVILSLMGGIMGIIMAFCACHVLSAAGVPTSVNPLIVMVSALFAALVGVAFGYYPALKAARLYPIDALRYE